MKKSTTVATMANGLLKVLQRYTKGIRLVAVLTMLFTVGVGSMWGETATNNCGSALSATATDMESGKLIQWKVSSTNSYSNPIRVYANTTITITAKSGVKRITQVEVTASSTGNYVTNTEGATWTASGNGTCTVGTKSVSEKVITVPMNGDVKTVTIKPSAQTRWSKVVVTYELDASCDKKVILTKGSETNGTFTLDKANGSYDNCNENFVVKVSNIKPKSASQYCSGINVTGGNSSVTGPVDGVWTVTYAKGNNITSTITPVFANKASASIDFVNMGTPAPTTTGYYVGDTYTLPSENNFTCGDKTFVGWSTEIIENSPTKPTAATYFEPGASVILAATQTFYAVFAETSGDGEEGWQKVTSTDQVKDGEMYAFISFDEAYYLANALSTSDPIVRAVSKTNGILDVTDEMKWIATANNAGFEFKSYSNNNYYLWGGSANDAIRINTTSTKANATKVWYTKILNTYGVVIYHNASTDGAKYLATNGSSNWRNYLNNNTLGNTNRVANLYKFTSGATYSDYTTSCITETTHYLLRK